MADEGRGSVRNSLEEREQDIKREDERKQDRKYGLYYPLFVSEDRSKYIDTSCVMYIYFSLKASK